MIHCPFCGSNDHTKIENLAEYCSERGVLIPEVVPKMRAFYHVVCDEKLGCGASAGWRKTPDEAMKAWLTRFDPQMGYQILLAEVQGLRRTVENLGISIGLTKEKKANNEH